MGKFPKWRNGARPDGTIVLPPREFYVRSDFARAEHHARYKRHVEAMPRKLQCQDCGGMGEHGRSGYEPPDVCDWCEGTGLVTPHRRGEWLRYRRRLSRPKSGT